MNIFVIYHHYTETPIYNNVVHVASTRERAKQWIKDIGEKSFSRQNSIFSVSCRELDHEDEMQ